MAGTAVRFSIRRDGKSEGTTKAPFITALAVVNVAAIFMCGVRPNCLENGDQCAIWCTVLYLLPHICNHVRKYAVRDVILMSSQHLFPQ